MSKTKYLTHFSYYDINRAVAYVTGKYQMNWYLYMAKKRPSFIIGIASLFDFIFGIERPYNKPISSQLTGMPNDDIAILGDWVITGQDMRTALRGASVNDRSK